MSDDPDFNPANQCGVGNIFSTGPDDPFYRACLVHDAGFKAHHEAVASGDPDHPAANTTLSQVNTAFLQVMNSIIAEKDRTALERIALEAEKVFYYTTVKAVAWYWWA